MGWTIVQTKAFEEWFISVDEPAKEDIRSSVRILSEIGPGLGRPHVDTISGSSIKNLKELRVQSNGRPFRIFFVFDPKRNGVLLIGGNKEGNDRFYNILIPEAEKLYAIHLKESKNEGKGKKSSKKKRK